MPGQDPLYPGQDEARRLSRMATTSKPPNYPADPVSYPPQRLSIGERIPRSHASIHNFGSRFIPHATSTIHTILPIMTEHLLLLGTDEGLSILDLLPGQRGLAPPSIGSSLADANARPIWRGEAVYQLALLEASLSSTNPNPQGVVLALVGSDPHTPNPEGRNKTVRMYNLASLCSLIAYVLDHPVSDVKTIHPTLSLIVILGNSSRGTRSANGVGPSGWLGS